MDQPLLGIATQTLEKVGTMLNAIDQAVTGIIAVTRKLDEIDQVLATWRGTRGKLASLADSALDLLAQA